MWTWGHLTQRQSLLLAVGAVLALALAVTAGLLAGLRDSGAPLTADDDTQVAGNVIERTEASESPSPTPSPRPSRSPRPVVGPQSAQTPPVEDDGAVDGGLVEAEEEPPPPPPPPPDREPQAEPRARQTPPPRPAASPTPSPSPSPTFVMLRRGSGHTDDRVMAHEEGGWTFVANGEPRSDGPDDPAARLRVGFAEVAEGDTAALRCRARVNAGDVRLRTSTGNVFEISLFETDRQGRPIATVLTVFEQHAFDLAPGRRSEAMTTDPVEVDSSEGRHYACGVRYRAKP